MGIEGPTKLPVVIESSGETPKGIDEESEGPTKSPTIIALSGEPRMVLMRKTVRPQSRPRLSSQVVKLRMALMALMMLIPLRRLLVLMSPRLSLVLNPSLVKLLQVKKPRPPSCPVC